MSEKNARRMSDLIAKQRSKKAKGPGCRERRETVKRHPRAILSSAPLQERHNVRPVLTPCYSAWQVGLGHLLIEFQSTSS